MMKVLLLNYPYLEPELRGLGLTVASVGLTPDCDHRLNLQDYSLRNAVRAAGFTPDRVVFMDSLERVIPRGLEDSPCPLAAFFLDSPINTFWQHPIARAFDLVLTDQPGDADRLHAAGIDARWFPLAADTQVYHTGDSPREYDIVFVGHRNRETRQKRENILHLLGERFRLTRFTGDPPLTAAETAAVYRRSRLVLNENLFPALNLRLFEASACGAAVLTENAPGLEHILQDGESVITYDPDNLLDRVQHYLTDDTERERVAAQGARLVQERHSFAARAADLRDLLEAVKPQSNLNKWTVYSGLAEAFIGYYLKWHGRDRDAINIAATYLERIDAAHMDRNTAIQAGMLHILAGQAREAADLFQSAAARDGDPKGLLLAGVTLHQAGVTTRARQFLAAAQRRTGYDSSDVLEPGGEAFHRFWGDWLQQAGEPLTPGLMRSHLPMQFWTALEHLVTAAHINPVHWEAVGDLLMAHSAPDQALTAYSNGDGNIPREKIRASQRGAYLAFPD